MVTKRKRVDELKFKLISAFHPKRFEKGVYAVSFVEKGKPLVDKFTRFTQIKARSRVMAIKKAKVKLDII